MRRLVPVDGRELIGSPYPGVVGDIILYNIDLGGTVTLDGDSFMHAFKGTQDVSSSVLSGDLYASGNILRAKLISAEAAGTYRYTFRCTLNGQKIVRYFYRKVERESGAR